MEEEQLVIIKSNLLSELGNTMRAYCWFDNEANQKYYTISQMASEDIPNIANLNSQYGRKQGIQEYSTILNAQLAAFGISGGFGDELPGETPLYYTLKQLYDQAYNNGYSSGYWNGYAAAGGTPPI